MPAAHKNCQNQLNKYTNPEDKEMGSQSHEHGGNKADEELFGHFSSELCGCDFINEKPSSEKESDSQEY